MYIETKEFLAENLHGIFQGSAPNQYGASPIFLEPNDVNQEFFNSIYFKLKASDLNKLERTPSGSIKKGPRYYNNLYAWDLRKSSLGLMITVCIGGFIHVVKYGNFKGTKTPELFPNVAFNMFVDECKKVGIDLDSYKIKNGQEVKAEIERPLIKMYMTDTEKSKGLTNVHHIDFHNSYPAGLANTHPEFKPVIEKLYKFRKVMPEYKFVLNDTIGWMQSWAPEKGRFASWAHLSRDAIKDNNQRIIELTGRLILSGRTIIGHNTDGIWYQGEIYHGEGEGPELGQWENDHVNCTFRAKSDGAYEFIEDGQYHAVVRGTTTLDAIEPDRTKWHWGDIFKQHTKQFYFDEERGIYNEEV